MGRYILRKLFKTYRNSKHYREQQYQEAMALIKSGKSNMENQNSKLIEALSRGGLWQVSNEIKNILILSEKIFYIDTKKQSRNIQVFSIVQKLMEFQAIQNYFKVCHHLQNFEIFKNIFFIFFEREFSKFSNG